MILQVYDSAHAMDLTAWKLYLAEQNANGTPLSFLADCQPQTFQLTPLQIEAVFGINTIWSDSGDVTVTYSRQSPIYGWTAIGAYVSPTLEASDADMYFVDLNGTRYGGTVDFLSGKMLVTMVGIDMGTLNWQLDDTQYYVEYNAVSPRPKIPSSILVAANAFCSNYRVVARNDATNGTFCISHNGNLVVYDSRYTSAADFKTAMNGVQLVYEIATPIEVQLTPQQIELLVGTNYIWSDDGNVVHVKTRTYENEEDSDVIDVDYITTIQYDGMMCGEGIIPKVKM